MAKEYGWKFRRKGLVVGRTGDPAKVWTHEEYQRLMAISLLNDVEIAARRDLLRRGYQGDRQALEELKARYRLRLPLVEEALSRQDAEYAKVKG